MALEYTKEEIGHIYKLLDDDVDLPQELYDKIYEYYLDSGDMPYGVAKGRTGDPYEWILHQLDGDFAYGARHKMTK